MGRAPPISAALLYYLHIAISHRKTTSSMARRAIALSYPHRRCPHSSISKSIVAAATSGFRKVFHGACKIFSQMTFGTSKCSHFGSIQFPVIEAGDFNVDGSKAGCCLLFFATDSFSVDLVTDVRQPATRNETFIVIVFAKGEHS